MVLLGFKLSALKRFVQVSQRRTELIAALKLLQAKLEEEDRTAWLDDVLHDAAQREDRIAELAVPAGHIHSPMETGMIEQCLRMFAWFETSSTKRSVSGVTRSALKRSASMTPPALKQSATITRLETNHDAATGCLLGMAEATIRAGVLEIVADFLNVGSRFMTQSTHAGSVSLVRFECLEHVNPHHTVMFSRYKARRIVDRTFLTSVIAKRVAEDPLTYTVAVVPIPSHDKITRKDEAGAVRAETYRIFRLVEVAPCVTKLEYSSSLDLKGWVPQIVTDALAGPAQMELVKTQQTYFQQIRPLSKCDAEDGWVVGQMLLELVEEKPKDLAHAVRTFVNRTAMLRECGFPHIGAMFTSALTADAHGGLGEDTTLTALNPSSVTEKQATAIGYTIRSSLRRAHAPATALRKVVESHAVLRAMKSGHVWFVRMLEVLTAHMATESRASMWMRRMTATTIVAPADVASDTDGDAKGSFSSVVQHPSQP